MPSSRSASRRAPRTTSRRRASSSCRAATRTRSALPNPRWSPGRPRWARLFHPWPVRSDDVDHPDELRLDLDPQPGTDFEDVVRVAGVARELLRDPGHAGFPKTSGGRGVHIYVRSSRAGRSPTSATPPSPSAASRAAPARGGHDQVVEGGAWRAHLRRLQPERPRPHDRVGLQRAAQARCTRLGPGHVGRADRGRPRGLHRRDDARALRRRRGLARRDRLCRAFAAAAAGHVRPRRGGGEGDMPYPPDYPKMPGEPKRVQLRDTDRRRD